MPDVALNVTILGEDVINRKIGTLQKNLTDFSPLWEQVAAWFYQMEAKQFASEGHGEWKPLAPSTVKQRQRKGYGGAHPILEMTGRLAASLLGAEGHVREQTPTSITLGSDLRVGKWNLGALHQTGTAHMPARHVIGRSTQAGKIQLYSGDTTSLRAIFARYIHQIATA